MYFKENVHQWLRKVEDASDNAINNVLKENKSNPNLSKSSNKNKKKDYDDPYSGTKIFF